ncbi:MAG: hypothetical protein JO267_00855 [Alphaproteobacteria bacterium]|nr:hypothetical protein [Alphaproteobacteria bacterium]
MLVLVAGAATLFPTNGVPSLPDEWRDAMTRMSMGEDTPDRKAFLFLAAAYHRLEDQIREQPNGPAVESLRAEQAIILEEMRERARAIPAHGPGDLDLLGFSAVAPGIDEDSPRSVEPAATAGTVPIRLEAGLRPSDGAEPRDRGPDPSSAALAYDPALVPDSSLVECLTLSGRGDRRNSPGSSRAGSDWIGGERPGACRSTLLSSLQPGWPVPLPFSAEADVAARE